MRVIQHAFIQLDIRGLHPLLKHRTKLRRVRRACAIVHRKREVLPHEIGLFDLVQEPCEKVGIGRPENTDGEMKRGFVDRGHAMPPSARKVENAAGF